MPSCLGAVGSVRTRQNIQSATVGVRRPDLLPVDDVVVAVARRARVCKAGQVGAGARLAVALAPADLAAHDRRQVLALLLLAAVLEQHRAEHPQAEAASAARGSRARAAPRRGSPPRPPTARRRRTASARWARSSRAPPCARATAARRRREARLPAAPDLVALAGKGVRIEGGQLSSSQRRTPAGSARARRQSAHAVALHARARQVERDVLDHVLLAADRLAPAHLDEDIARRHAVALAGALREQEERRVDAGIAEDRARRDRCAPARPSSAPPVLGDVHQLVEVDAVLRRPSGRAPRRTPRAACCPRRRRGRPPSRRCGARPPRPPPASWRCPCRGCGARESRPRSRPSSARSSADARRHVVGQHVAGRVGEVDAVGAVALHQLGLHDQLARARSCAPSSGSRRCRCPACATADVLRGDVGLGAVRGDAHRADAAVDRHAQIVDGADAGQQQRRDLARCFSRGITARRYSSSRVAREAVVDRRAAQAVAVGDLDQRHAGVVERRRRPRSSARA